MTLRDDIASWDLKSADAIRDTYGRHAGAASFLNEIVDLLREASLQPGATWLLKHHLDSGGGLDQRLAGRVFTLLPQLQHWSARLHVLQCIPHLAIPSRRRKNVEAFLGDCLADPNKFVRAWTYGAFHQLAVQYPEHQPAVTALLERALREEAPAVKARVRRVVKQGFAPAST